MPPRLCPAPSLLGPLRDQVLVGAGQAAQLGDGTPPCLILVAPAPRRAERQPGHLGQQVAAAAGDLPQLGHCGGLVLGQGTPPGVSRGDAVQPGDEEAVSVRSRAVSAHLARIEY
jgi:hypothetical protein